MQVGPDKYELPLNLSLTFRGKDLALEQETVLFSGATEKELIGQRRVVKLRDDRRQGQVQLAEVPAWLDAQLVFQPDGTGEVRFTLKQLPKGAFTRQVVRLVRQDDPEATVPLAVLVYGGEE